ncbi:MAG: hypothetical protein KGL98_11050 [Gammaproteobacteria bacterium]|nr:hypothetical protein [Gammaproteobacteria bacterium]MBU6508722.1 hypothetical protein [Gammaproteobacteria bacterium]MDE1983028.1 hypothetical protein [Gammaproteobacteria bacterium]MDE2107613.1 hypothetical protein [Gammaproteobacteria bacterium]MDE2461764.1 hypothetical protein [Gammaproteobacteria bacterium]
MPLTAKGRKILQQMQKEYGPEKGKSVFYAARNKGRITDVDRPSHRVQPRRGRFTGAPG